MVKSCAANTQRQHPSIQSLSLSPSPSELSPQLFQSKSQTSYHFIHNACLRRQGPFLKAIATTSAPLIHENNSIAPFMFYQCSNLPTDLMSISHLFDSGPYTLPRVTGAGIHTQIGLVPISGSFQIPNSCYELTDLYTLYYY